MSGRRTSVALPSAPATSSAIDAFAPATPEARRDALRAEARGVVAGVDRIIAIIRVAAEARDDEALGYESWTAYVRDNLRDAARGLDRVIRRELVAELADMGMSTRAIAPVFGVSNKTVSTDLSGVKKVTPEPEPPTPVTGLDGKTYERKPVVSIKTETTETFDAGTGEQVDTPTPKRPPRRPLTLVAHDTGIALRSAADKLARIHEDDRYPRNKEEVAAHLRGHLMYAIDTCQGLLDDLNQSQED